MSGNITVIDFIEAFNIHILVNSVLFFTSSKIFKFS